MNFDKNGKKPKKTKNAYDMPLSDTLLSDVEGSYTGVPVSTVFDGVYEEPLQDADDL